LKTIVLFFHNQEAFGQKKLKTTKALWKKDLGNFKVHLVMQPHGFEGSSRSRSIKIGYNTAHAVCK
jgi:hypothetical protein